MEEKNNLLENKKTDFMDGFKYEIGNMYALLRKHGTNARSASDAPNDLEIKNRLQEFLESGNKKESVDIGSVNLIFKKLIEQNCIIGKETIKYLCGLCPENQKDDKNNLVSENNLIPILLKTEYEHYDEKNNNQGKPKIRKCILTNDLFEEIINKIEKEEINRDNIKHIFELVGNIVGGLFSTKNQIDEKKILDMIKQFGKENTLDVLCDFFIKGDLSVISAKITFAFAGYHNLVEMRLLTKLIGYGEFFAEITKGGAQSATINLIDFVNDIKTVYENLISNQLNKVEEEDKLEWYKLHREFIFSILNGILLNVTDKAPKEEKQEEEQKFVTFLSDKMKKLLVGKEKNSNEGINVINNEGRENNDYDFISAMLQKIYSAVENVLTIGDEKIKELTVNKSADGELEFVEVIKQGNVISNAWSFFFGSSEPKKQREPQKFKITNFLKDIWGKLEDKEKNHLKALVLPIVFKMFGKETWKKNILMYGLKMFGLENFDQINNKSLDLIFESAMQIIDNLPNEKDKDNDKNKKDKISTISSKLKHIINVLFQTNQNENLEQIKDSVDSLIDILFLLPKNFKDKDGKTNFTPIKEFLDDINKDKEGKKWTALCKVIKPFLSDKHFLETLISSIRESGKKETEDKEADKKEALKKEVLISGLEVFAGNFDKLSNNIKEIMLDLIGLYESFKDKNGEMDYAQIKNFLDSIVKDENKLTASNNLLKLFCSDKDFLTNLDGLVGDILGKDSWQKNVLMSGLKLFGQAKADNGDLKLIFEFAIMFLDDLLKKKNKDDKFDVTKIKNFLNGIVKDGGKLTAANNLLKLFCADNDFLTNLGGLVGDILGKDSWQKNVLMSGLKLFGQVKADNGDLKLIFEFAIMFLDDLLKKKSKDDKFDITKIKSFLNGIVEDGGKLTAANNLLKLFCADNDFLTNLIDGLAGDAFGKDSWQKNVLMSGLKLFGVRFDNLKSEDLKSVFESVTKIIDNLPNGKETDEQKNKQKISAITEATKTIFSILLVGKNGNKNFDMLAQNLIDILLNDNLSQVEIIDKVKNILSIVRFNFVNDKNSAVFKNAVFKNFIKSFLNNGDFLLEIVNNVEELKPVKKNGKIEREGLTDEDRNKNWFAPVLDNLCRFLINDIDNSKNFVDHISGISGILNVYQNFAKSIDIPASAKCCKDAFLDLEGNNGNSILSKINAVDPVKEKYNALKNFFEGKDKLVHNQDKNKDDFKKLEKLYKSFMQEFYNSNIVLTKDEQEKFDKFRFTFEINQNEIVNSVRGILRTVNDILHSEPADKQQEKLACVKGLLKSVIKDGRILKFITASDELKPIHLILNNAFEQLAKLIEIKIDGISDVISLNKFVTDDINGLLNEYKAFASYLDSDSKNNQDYQTKIIDSIERMITYIKTNFLINDKQESKTAYQNLLKAFFSSIKNGDKLSLFDSVANIISANKNDPDETNILTFVIDKIDDKAMPETSKAALKKSLSCLMSILQDSVGKEKFENNLFQLFESYKTLAKELDKSFDFQAAKDFVGGQNIKNKYVEDGELNRALDGLSQEINKLVPDTKEIMHKYKLFRNKIQEITNTGNKSFELTKEQKNIFEGFELDQNEAISAIKDILMSISSFCCDNQEMKNENNIINTNISNDNELNNNNERPFNKVLINLLQNGDFLKNIIDGIDSKNNADMIPDLKNYLASLSSPLCKFLISYLEKTNDTPSEIANKFNEIMSKYLEVMKVINDAEINIDKLLQQVENLLQYLEDNIVNGNQTVFGNYKNLYSAIVSGGTIFNLLAAEVQNNLDDNTKSKYRKYFQLVDKKNVWIFGHIFNKISDNVKDKKFFSGLISKFRNAYSIFSQSKSLSKSIKNLFGVRKRSNNNQNTDIDNENHVFKIIMGQLEWERPSSNTMINDKNTIIQRNTNSNLINKNTDNNILNNSYKNIISNATKNEIEGSKNGDKINLIDKEEHEESLDNQDDKIYLSEFLFASSWKITRWLAELLLINQKTFDALKTYINQAKNDDEIIDTLDRIINLNDLLNMYITFWRVTNLLFWRESKWYYPVVVGEIILSLTIFSPFVIPSSLYSLAKYFWTWLFKKNDVPPKPPSELPHQHKNLQNQNIVIDTGVQQNNKKNKTDEIIIIGDSEKNSDDNIIISGSDYGNKKISMDKF